MIDLPLGVDYWCYIVHIYYLPGIYVTRYLFPDFPKYRLVSRDVLRGYGLSWCVLIYSPAKRIGGTDYLFILCMFTTTL